MKIGICDDQPEVRNQIWQYCKQLGYELLFSYSSGEELLNDPNISSINLLFLDIEMDGISGIEIKERLAQINPSTFIVFCTTHQELMTDAFGRNVISFLTKPISIVSIEHCILKATYLTRDFYAVTINNQTAIPCKDILYLHAEQKYTIFYTVDGLSISTKKPLKNWISELKELGFCPVSRSAVINLKYYVKTQKKQVLLYGGTTITVSRRYTTQLKETFDAYMLRKMRSEC